MFLRSARNAEFDIPKEYIDDAMQYIRRCFDRNRQTFMYGLSARNNLASRGVVGGGIVSLALGGQHKSEMATAAGNWILRHNFDEYNRCDHRSGYGPYHYGAYYCSHAMFQLGGAYWEKFFPRMARTLVNNQRV